MNKDERQVKIMSGKTWNQYNNTESKEKLYGEERREEEVHLKYE